MIKKTKCLPFVVFSAVILVFLRAFPAMSDTLTPVVVFPAFHFTILNVDVVNQTKFPECPASGQFEDWFPNPNPSQLFSQECQDKLLSLVYDSDPSKLMHLRFSNQPGVIVSIEYYGRTESSPFYEDMYAFLESAGYIRNKNIRVAGYDSRLTPDMNGFLELTKQLIMATYYQNNETPVHLIGHSNGPLYAQYLLTHTSQAWKDKYIHGFTPIAGNWPGQGLLYTIYFTGLNIVDFSFPEESENALSSATMYHTLPSTYMSSADPDIFKDNEVVIEVQNGKTYTPQDITELFIDAGLGISQELAPYYVGFVKFDEPSFFPNVDVYAEIGSGLNTSVGTKLNDLTIGQTADDIIGIFERDGDANQEDITNYAIEVWRNMDCFRFEFTDNVGVDHFSLPSDTALLQRLLFNLQRPKSVCNNAIQPNN